MSNNDDDRISSSYKINPDDFSEAHILPVDTVGIHKQLRNLQPNIYGYIHEVTQNMFDSNDSGKPNRLQIFINKKSNEPNIIFRDQGPSGITKQYGTGNINAFIEQAKATTRKDSLGGRRKGIGMFQYTNIAPHVLIISMDAEQIYRIPMWENPEGATAYGKVITRNAFVKENQIQNGIFHPGTIVAFFDRDKRAERIDEKELFNKTQEKWALRLLDEKRVYLTINNRQVLPPQWIIDHPPEVLQRLDNGTEIRGNIWYDEKGNGRLKVFQLGYLVEEIFLEPRQCSGYLECNTLETDAGRTAFLKDIQWSEFKNKALRVVCKFPRISPEIENRKNVARVLDMAQMILNLPKMPTAFGSSSDLQKKKGIGNRNGKDIVGYPVSDKEPDPDRDIIPRPPHPRDNEHQTRVGSDDNGDSVQISSDDQTGKRTKHRALDIAENQPCGDRPLFILFTDRKPYLLVENRDNEEHAIYESLKKPGNVGALLKLYNIKLMEWLSELNCEMEGNIDESARMALSHNRIKSWKQFYGALPKPQQSAQQQEQPQQKEVKIK